VYGNYCINIPYDELIEIVKEKNLLNLSELKDAEIQPNGLVWRMPTIMNGWIVMV
jgi:hypothetical protein